MSMATLTAHTCWASLRTKWTLAWSIPTSRGRSATFQCLHRLRMAGIAFGCWRSMQCRILQLGGTSSLHLVLTWFSEKKCAENNGISSSTLPRKALTHGSFLAGMLASMKICSTSQRNSNDQPGQSGLSKSECFVQDLIASTLIMKILGPGLRDSQVLL